jgi:AcrR family transcriptional regulator
MSLSTTSSTGRPNKRRELGDKSRGEILDAALATMSAQGYEGATVAKIASASGLPASSIYWHFGSKAGVLAAVMDRGASEFFAEYDQLFAQEAPAADPRATLEAAFAASQRAVENHPEFLRLMILLGLSGQHDEKVAAVVRETSQRGHDSLHALITSAFRGYGPEVSRRVADALVDVAQAYFDGSFLTTQLRGDDLRADLPARLAETIYRLGLPIAEA